MCIARCTMFKKHISNIPHFLTDWFTDRAAQIRRNKCIDFRWNNPRRGTAPFPPKDNGHDNAAMQWVPLDKMILSWLLRIWPSTKESFMANFFWCEAIFYHTQQCLKKPFPGLNCRLQIQSTKRERHPEEKGRRYEKCFMELTEKVFWWDIPLSLYIMCPFMRHLKHCA